MRGVAPEVSAQRSGAANGGGGPQAPPTRSSELPRTSLVATAFVDDVQQSPAPQKALRVVDKTFHDLTFESTHVREVRRNDHVVHIPERGIRRKRLLREHIETGSAELAGSQPLDQRR